MAGLLEKLVSGGLLDGPELNPYADPGDPNVGNFKPTLATPGLGIPAGVWGGRIASNAADSLMSAATLPGDTYLGKADPSGPDFGRVMDLAGVVTPGPLVSKAPKGALSVGPAGYEEAMQGILDANPKPKSIYQAPMEELAAAHDAHSEVTQKIKDELGITGFVNLDDFKKLQSHPDFKTSAANLKVVQAKVAEYNKNNFNAQGILDANSNPLGKTSSQLYDEYHKKFNDYYWTDDPVLKQKLYDEYKTLNKQYTDTVITEKAGKEGYDPYGQYTGELGVTSPVDMKQLYGDLPDTPAARMERAKQLGFDPETTFYHGRSGEFEGNAFQHPTNKSERAIFLTKDPDIASVYADNGHELQEVMPLLARMENPHIVDVRGKSYGNVDLINHIEEARDKGHDSIIIKNMKDVGPRGEILQDQYGIFDPRNLRSKFAAFNPSFANTANLLSTGGLPVGILDPKYDYTR